MFLARRTSLCCSSKSLISIASLVLLLRKGDQILEVDSLSLHHAALSEAHAVLRDCGPGLVRLVISRHRDHKVGTVWRFPVHWSKYLNGTLNYIKQNIMTSLVMKSQCELAGDLTTLPSSGGQKEKRCRTNLCLSHILSFNASISVFLVRIRW